MIYLKVRNYSLLCVYQEVNKIKKKLLVLSGSIFFLIVISISVISVSTDKNNKPVLNTQLKNLLMNYSRGEINSDYRVQLLLDFKDQSQNLKAYEINNNYSEINKPSQSKIKNILKKYEPKKKLNHSEEQEYYKNHPIDEQDEKIIKDNVEQLQKIDEGRRQVIKKELNKIVKNKQKNFIAELKNKNGVVVAEGKYYNSMTVDVPISTAKILSEDERFSNIYTNQVYEETIALNVSAWAIRAHSSLWTDTTIGASVNSAIAFVDTGVNMTNSLLYLQDGSFRPNWVDKSWVDWNNDTIPDENPSDNVNQGGHGTIAASVVFSSNKTFQGILYNATKLINAKAGAGCVSTPGGTKCGNSQIDDYENALDWAAYDIIQNYSIGPAKVINSGLVYRRNMSSDYMEGTGVDSNGESIPTFFMDAIIDNSGIVAVVPADNKGPDTGTLSQPSDAFNAITVGAIDDKGSTVRTDDSVFSWSSRGFTADGRRKPDVSAPGSICVIGNDEQTWCKIGTSFAAPHVTAIAAWLADYGLNNLEIKAVIINGADKLNPDEKYNKSYGYGYINLDNSYNHKGNVFYETNFAGATNGGTSNFYRYGSLTSSPVEPATLVWNRHIGYNTSSCPNYTQYLCPIGTTHYLNMMWLFLYNESDGSLIDSDVADENNVLQVYLKTGSIDSGIIKVKPVGNYFVNESYALATEEQSLEVGSPKFNITSFLLPTISGTSCSNVEFKVNTTNYGDIKAHNIQIQIDLPSGVTFISGSNPQNLVAMVANNTQTATWNLSFTSSFGSKPIVVNVSSSSYGETFKESKTVWVNASCAYGLYVNIKTLKNTYDDGEFVNITDPPDGVSSEGTINYLVTRDTAWTVLKNDYITKYVDYKFVYVNDSYYRVDWKWKNLFVRDILKDCIFIKNNSKQKECMQDALINNTLSEPDSILIKGWSHSFYQKQISEKCTLPDQDKNRDCKKDLTKNYFNKLNFGMKNFSQLYFSSRDLVALENDVNYLQKNDMPKQVLRGNAEIIGTINPLVGNNGSFYIKMNDGFWNSNGLTIKWDFNTTIVVFNNNKTEENLTFLGNQNITRYFELLKYANVTQASLYLNGSLYFGFVYRPNSFNMTDGCSGLINISPTSSYTLDVCLQNGTGEDVTESCRTYETENFGSGNEFATSNFNKNSLSEGQQYRFRFRWKRIGYMSMNNSDLNGKFDHGESVSGTHLDNCVWVSNIYMRAAIDCWTSGYPEITGLWIGSTTCSGGTRYNATTLSSTPKRIYEGYIRDDGSNATRTGQFPGSGCYNLGSDSIYTTFMYSEGCYTPPTMKSVEHVENFWQSCVPGTPDSSPGSLCTYAGDNTDYSAYFIYNSSKNITSTNFTNKLISNGSVEWIEQYPQNPYIEIGTPDVDHEWNHSGIFNTSEKTNDFSYALNAALNNGACNCNGCSANGNNCIVPVLFHSNTAGILKYSNININYEDNKSRIINNAIINASIYLLMKVQFWNGTAWLDEKIIQNDTSPRIIQPGVSNQLKLDAIWNPNAWNTATNSHGSGVYRAYVTATNANGTILQNYDGKNITASYNFTLISGVLIQNSSGANVAILDYVGNIMLKGSCTSTGACNPTANSFIIKNATDGAVAYINETGDMCISVGTCTDGSATCNPSNDAFIIQDSTGKNVSYIDKTGDLCLIGTLTQNGSP